MKCRECKQPFEFVPAPLEVEEQTHEETWVKIHVSASCSCSECGSVLLDGALELEGEFDAEMKEHTGENHELRLEIDEGEAEVPVLANSDEAPSYLNITVIATLWCRCQDPHDGPLAELELSGRLELE